MWIKGSYMSRLWIVPVCLTLAGCGGGGGSSVSTWLKSEPAPADKSSQQLAQLGASDIPELPRIQMAANTAAPGVAASQRTGSQQSLPTVDMSKSWSTSVEAAPLDDLPPLPTSGSAPAVSSPSPVVSAPVAEASTPNAKEVPVLPSVSAAGSGNLPALPTVTVTATAPKAPLAPPKAVVSEPTTVAATSPSVVDPYADRTTAYMATQKTVSVSAPQASPSAVKMAALPSLTPAAPETAPVAAVGSVQSEALPVSSAPAVKPMVSKAIAQAEAPAMVPGNGKRYLVFASFNESEKAKILARRHAKLGATVLASEVGGAQVYRVAVPVGKSAATKRRDLAAAGLTDTWPLRM